jgi:chromate transporter
MSANAALAAPQSVGALALSSRSAYGQRSLTSCLPMPPTQPASLFAIYRLCFLVGLFSFGGGLTAWFHREIVQVRGWMTDDQFFSGYALAQILPGVNSTNMAVYIGQHLRGALGSSAALLGLLTGPFVIVIAAAAVYHHLVAMPGFAAVMGGVAAAAVGMMFRLGLTSAGRVHRHIPSLIVLVATFVAIGIMQWPLLPVLLVLAPLSIAASWPRKAETAGPETSGDA